MSWEIRQGDVLDRLREMPDESVHCVVTSPPYWGLRDYGVPDQLGLEATPEEYVAKMVEVFREVRRVLRSDGTCWLNLGDSYVASRGQGIVPGEGGSTKSRASFRRDKEVVIPDRGRVLGMKPKDLVGIPWRVAFALQADGWWLRSDIIWSKPNPMPESVTDRPTKAHEYVFLLTKSATYFYDADAIKEGSTWDRDNNPDWQHKRAETNELKGLGNRNAKSGGFSGWETSQGRNKRTVWTISTQPYPGAHFATFPTELPEICIKAGTSEGGCCAECGAPWERLVENEFVKTQENNYAPERRGSARRDPSTRTDIRERGVNRTTTTGWAPTCEHEAEPAPCTVLDPFAGSGTTLMVALQLGRDAIGIELNPEYVRLAENRIDYDCPLFNREVV